jgi:RimJ/RimL family protein N-acetyltransferase
MNNGFEGELVFVKTLRALDKKQIDEWNKDGEVTKYTEPSLEDAKKKKLKDLNFAVFDKKTSGLIGDIGISQIDLKNSHAEIGLTIGDKSLWGKGYGSDLVRAALKYCFQTLNLNKVYLDVWEENERAIRCYANAGFKSDGVLREHVFRNGRYYNKIIMSILKQEWKEK